MQTTIECIKDFIIKSHWIWTVIGILVLYKNVYLVIGFFSKAKKYPKTDIKKKYAIMIPARNEEKVIANLIDSIRKQTYDQSLITIFVVADNCTDQTAKIARELGVIVYERFNDQKRRKGWALEFLMEHIEKDFGIMSFDGYMVFDADNLLDSRFIHEINKAFVINKHIVNGYRNTKNFDTNLISSAYGIHFYRSTVAYHRPRSKLGLGTHIAGTGFVIASEHLKEGWKYHTLTEDTEITNHLATKNIKISFCEAAIFFDEQPTSFIVAFKQRMRWTSGRLVVFLKYWYRLLFGMFRYMSFTIFDIFMYLFPWGMLSLFKIILYPLAVAIIYLKITQGVFWLDFGYMLLLYFSSVYIKNAIYGIFVVIRERKNIHTTKIKSFMAALTYPWFNMISIFLALAVLLKPNVQWKQIHHNDQRKITDIIKEEDHD